MIISATCPLETRAVIRRCFSKRLFLKNSQILQENIVLESFLINLQAFRPATLLKRDSNPGVFL